MEEKEAKAAVHIITGAVNSGKTTELRRRIEKYRKLGKRPGGIITEAEWAGGRKSAFFVRRIGGKEKALVAVRKSGTPGIGSTGSLSFEFCREGFDSAARWIHEACKEGVDILCIDELGPLEIEGLGHWPAVVRAAKVFGGSMAVVVRKELLEEFSTRFTELGKRVIVEEVSFRGREA
ncbi:MAG: nucleoside-triphosphatase [Spirochaetia bacterium]